MSARSPIGPKHRVTHVLVRIDDGDTGGIHELTLEEFAKLFTYGELHSWNGSEAPQRFIAPKDGES